MSETKEKKIMIRGVDKVVGIIAGKGGVGKSTVTVNLALALKEQGKRVGIIDADIYGPSIQKMLGEESAVKESEKGVIPAKGLGIDYISTASFHSHVGGAAIRAPIANQIISEFVEAVVWDDLDYLLIDFPPGTGDIQLTLLQHTILTGAIAVTTPQDVAALDVRKSVHMIDLLHIPLLGIVENMSYFLSESKERYALFGSGGGENLAREFEVPLLGAIPLDPVITRCADRAVSLFRVASKSSCVFDKVANNLERELIIHKEEGKGCLGVFELIWDCNKRNSK